MKGEPTKDSVIKENMFGHCSFAPKDLTKHKCPGMFQKYYSDKVKVERKSVDGLIYLDEYYKCSCPCHIPEGERPKPKRTRKKATPRRKK